MEEDIGGSGAVVDRDHSLKTKPYYYLSAGYLLRRALLAWPKVIFEPQRGRGYDLTPREPQDALRYSNLHFIQVGVVQFMSLRAVFLLGFVVAMPVMALPAVARRIDELLYGSPKTGVEQSLQNHQPEAEPRRSPNAASISPATYHEQSPAGIAPTAHIDPGPPPLAPVAPFVPLDRVEIEATRPKEPRIDQQTISRLQQIRRRLEELGAEYVVVDYESDQGPYRFGCRMLIDERSRFTRPFEAASADPVVAAEQVLRDVEAWRTAGAANRVLAP